MTIAAETLRLSLLFTHLLEVVDDSCVLVHVVEARQLQLHRAETVNLDVICRHTIA